METILEQFEKCFTENGVNKKEYDEFKKKPNVKQNEIFSLRAVKYVPKQKIVENVDDDALSWGEESERMVANKMLKHAPIELFECILKDGFIISMECYIHIINRDDILLEKKKQLISQMMEIGVYFNTDIYVKIFTSLKTPESVEYLFNLVIDCEKKGRNMKVSQLNKKNILGLAISHFGKQFVALLMKNDFIFELNDISQVLKLDSYSIPDKLEILNYVDQKNRKLSETIIQENLFHIVNDQYTGKPIDLKFIDKLEKLGFSIPLYAWIYFTPFYIKGCDYHHEQIKDVCLWFQSRIMFDNRIFHIYWKNRSLYHYKIRSLEAINKSSIDHQDANMLRLATEIEKEDNLKKSKSLFDAYIKKEQHDFIEWKSVYNETPEESFERIEHAKLQGSCRYFEQNRCRKTPDIHVNPNNKYGINIQGTCVYYHGPITNTYKLIEVPEVYELSNQERRDPTICPYITNEVNVDKQELAQKYINMGRIPSHHEKDVAKLFNECWWLQYTPSYNGKALDMSLNGFRCGINEKLPYFELIPAVCYESKSFYNLRFMAINEKQGEIWARYYSDITFFWKNEGEFFPYILQEPMNRFLINAGENFPYIHQEPPNGISSSSTIQVKESSSSLSPKKILNYAQVAQKK